MDIFEMGMPQNTTFGTRYHVCRYLHNRDRHGSIDDARWRTLTKKKDCYQPFDTLEDAKDWARALVERGVLVHAIAKIEYSGRKLIAIKDITNPKPERLKPFKPAGEYVDYGSW